MKPLYKNTWLYVITADGTCHKEEPLSTESETDPTPLQGGAHRGGSLVIAYFAWSQYDRWDVYHNLWVRPGYEKEWSDWAVKDQKNTQVDFSA
jgi:hypothetical protein